MRIEEIVIAGINGYLAITRAGSGAMVTKDHEIVAEIGRNDRPEDRFAKARMVARHVYGSVRGEPKATNSMVHEVLAEMERVAGC